QLEPLRTVADYLAAFNDAYEPDLYQATRLSEAEAAVTRAGQTMLPDVTLEQSLDWSAFHQVHLDLETGLRLPLYDSRAVPEVALAGADHEAAQAAAAAARTAARLSYFVDVATYAALV